MFYSDKYGFEWNEELSEKIFEKSSIGMAFVSVQEGKFLRANEALCEMLDYTEWELLSKTWKDVTAGQDIDADLEAVAALKNGEKQQYHMRKKYITKGSEIIDCYLYVQCIYEDNSKQKIKYFLSMVTPCEVIIDKNKKICPVPAESSIMKNNDNFFIFIY